MVDEFIDDHGFNGFHFSPSLAVGSMWTNTAVHSLPVNKTQDFARSMHWRALSSRPTKPAAMSTSGIGATSNAAKRLSISITTAAAASTEPSIGASSATSQHAWAPFLGWSLGYGFDIQEWDSQANGGHA